MITVQQGHTQHSTTQCTNDSLTSSPSPWAELWPGIQVHMGMHGNAERERDCHFTLWLLFGIGDEKKTEFSRGLKRL